MDERPDYCLFEDCLCLGAYGGRLCVGRMPHKRAHDDLFNTHRLCWDEDDSREINDADAYYIIKLLSKVRGDVKENNLYKPDIYYDQGEQSCK